MVEKEYAFTVLYNNLAPVMESCGFAPQKPDGAPRDATGVIPRGSGYYMDFAGEKGRLRLVYGDNRVHLLSGASDVDVSDDSAFNLDCTYLLIADEYDDKDLKSLSNEISEYLTDTYAKKVQIVSKKKNLQTVSKTAARSGALSYDPITLASKLAAMYPGFKDEIRANVDTYGEFLCEDFFVNHANAEILRDIREGNPQRLKKLFGILGEIYEDGTNEVQSLIAVTVLGPVKNDPTVIQRIMPYLTDTMLEPVLAVNKRLGKSKSANLRLEHPPKYKPKKEKRPGLMQKLMGGAQPGLNQQ